MLKRDILLAVGHAVSLLLGGINGEHRRAPAPLIAVPVADVEVPQAVERGASGMRTSIEIPVLEPEHR